MIAHKTERFPSLDDVCAFAALHRDRWKLEASRVLEDEHGREVGGATRWSTPRGTRFLEINRTAEGWAVGPVAGPSPLYNLRAVLDAGPERAVCILPTVWAAEVVGCVGVLAAAPVGGFGPSLDADWDPLHGRRVVVDAGAAGANRVAEMIRSAGASMVQACSLEDILERGLDSSWGRVSC